MTLTHTTRLKRSGIVATLLIFSTLKIAFAADTCSKDSEGNWKTAKGAPCYMGGQQLGQPVGGTSIASPAATPIAASTGGMPVGNSVVSAEQPAPAMQFTVSRADRTIRETLVKWSKAAGWTFDSEHWVLDRDIPVSGSANLGTDFKSATRQLLKSTELSDKPAQPCFYSNGVVRVIPINDTCARAQ